jgi:hypothetical protein
MSKIGIIPRRIHFELISTRDDLIPIDFTSAFSWFINGKEIPRRTSSTNALSRFDFVMEELKNILPIFSRFYSSLTLLDSSLRQIAAQTISLAESLKNEGIQVIFMSTASSHHLETQILELAARISDIPQIFEYYLPDTLDVLPFLQTQGISTRKILPYRYEHQFESKFLLSLKNEWKAPRDIALNSPPLYRSSYNYRLSQLKVALGYPLRMLGANGEFERRNDHYLGYIKLREELKLLKIQNESFKTLNQFLTQDLAKVQDLISLGSEGNPALCIYAQFQPEATTFPEGGKITNQIDLVAQIRALGHSEPILYLEHPATKGFSQGIKSNRVGVSRRTSYYETLRDLGCLFVDRSIFRELPSSIIPITMTGSIGLERSILGLNTIVSGFPWYKGIPGTLTLQDGLAHLSDLATYFDAQVAHDFLKDLIEFRAYPSTPLLRSPDLFPEIEKWKKMYHFLLDQSLEIAN